MKKYFVFLMIVLLIPGGFAAFHGDDQQQNVQLEESPGITPDSFLYSGDLLLDRFRVSLSIGSDSEAETRMNIAEERLAETQEMANKLVNSSGREEIDNAEAMSRSQREYRKEINAATDIAVNEGVSIETEESMKSRLNLYRNALENVRTKLENRNSPGVQGIETAIDASERSSREIENRREGNGNNNPFD